MDNCKAQNKDMTERPVACGLPADHGGWHSGFTAAGVALNWPPAPASTPDADDTLLERILYAALWGDKSIPPADQWSRADSEANGYRRAAEALRTRIRTETAREAVRIIEDSEWVYVPQTNRVDGWATEAHIISQIRAHFGLADGDGAGETGGGAE